MKQDDVLDEIFGQPETLEDVPFHRMMDFCVAHQKQWTSGVNALYNEKICEDYVSVVSKSIQSLNEAAYLESYQDELPEPERAETLAKIQDLEAVAENGQTDFYEKVYDSSHVNWSEIPVEVTGRNADYSKREPLLLTSKTIDFLGSEYQAYADAKFTETLQNVLERNTRSVVKQSVSPEALSKRRLPAGGEELLNSLEHGVSDSDYDFD